jgi:pyruvate formate lyase activating enzyme
MSNEKKASPPPAAPPLHSVERGSGGEGRAVSPLDRLTAPSTLVEPADAGAVRCLACAHRCLIRPGRRGICRVRRNEDGTLLAPRGYVSSLNPDPIEKKPFFHVLPGSRALTFGMLGCNLRCDFCQNWEISQTLKDPDALADARLMSAAAIVDAAVRTGCRSVISSYNEPLITVEWAVEVFGAARARRLLTGIVSNGFASAECLDYLLPWLDCVKIDLKAMSDTTYRRLGGRIEPVLDAIRTVHARGVWLEVVTLVVPGLNDSPAELRAAAELLASVSPDIPWHVTAFHADYHRLGGEQRTPAETLLGARQIGHDAGLRFVYAGNVWLGDGDAERTSCPGCGRALIERSGMALRRIVIAEGKCPSCGATVPGIWHRPVEPARGA